MDLNGHQEDAYAYVMPLGGYDMILGMPWIRQQDVRIDGKRSKLRIKSSKVTVRCRDKDAPRPVQVSAASFKLLAASGKGKKRN